MSTTRVHHKPACASVNPFASYAYQEIEENEDELEDEEDDDDDDGGDEMEWSDEEDIQDGYIDDSYIDDDLEEDFEDDYDSDSDNYDHKFDDDYENDSDTEEVDHDDEYLDDDEEESHFKNNNYASAGPGYFYPEQPYIGPPVVPKPEPEASSSKLRYYVLTPICDIATIYIKFAILAILVYACALWYTVYFGDLSSITTTSDIDDNDADTCPA